MIADFISSRAKLSPNKMALFDYAQNKNLSFAKLNENSNKVANFLIKNNINKGDTIGVLCRNRIEFFVLLFACAKIGAILVPLNWRSPANEIKPLFEDAKCKLLFCGQQEFEISKEITNEKNLIIFDNDFEKIINEFDEIKPRNFWPEDECWYLIFTSGTTGKPKAVIQTYKMAIANYINLGQAIGINENDKFLNFLPLFHTAGINLHTLPALIHGCTSTIISNFDAKTVLELINKGEVSCFFGVPQVYLLLSQHENFENTDFSKLRHLGCGGAPMPDYLIEVFANRGAIVCNGMGMTETGPTVFMMDCANVKRKIGSVGKSQILTIARVVDENYNDCPPNIAGSLIFSGPNITIGYWNNKQASDESFYIDESGNRWLKSGDLAIIDDEGYYYLVGRSKEMFISGGENVYPAEVENALLNHEDIIEAAVIGIDDDKWGEIGIAFISVKNKNLDDIVLSQFCRKHLAAYKIPKKFIIVDDFPRTAAGKIQKHILKAQYNNAV